MLLLHPSCFPGCCGIACVLRSEIQPSPRIISLWRFWWTVMFYSDFQLPSQERRDLLAYGDVQSTSGWTHVSATKNLVNLASLRGLSFCRLNRSALEDLGGLGAPPAVMSERVCVLLWLYLDVFLATRFFRGWLLNKKIMTWRAWGRGLGERRPIGSQLFEGSQ